VSAASPQSQRRSSRTLILAFLSIVVLVILDQWSKAAVDEWLDPPTNAEYRAFVEATGREWPGLWYDEALASAVAEIEAAPVPTEAEAWTAPALVQAAARVPGVRAAVQPRDLDALRAYLEDWALSDADNIDEFDELDYAAWSETRPPPEFSVGECHYFHQRRYLVLGTWLALMTTENYGAAFGQFGQFPHVLVGGRILAVLFLAWLLARGHAGAPARGQGWVTVAMTLVLAGAIGNLIDNLWTGAPKHGHPYLGVRDFIDVWFLPLGWDYHFPSFNVADSCISVGAVLWVLSGLFHRHEESQPEPEPSLENPPALP